MLTILDTQDAHFTQQLEKKCQYEFVHDTRLANDVQDIITSIKNNGEQALLGYCQQFDGIKANGVDELMVSAEQMETAYAQLSAETKKHIDIAATNIHSYHQQQMQGQKDWSYQDSDGNTLGQVIHPVDKVGIYVPGGKASYPSTVLMNAITAKVAGVKEIIMTVPTPNGAINPVVLACAFIGGVDSMFTIGGAQAVAALAYGVQGHSANIPAVDKIVGPGNQYVAEAKRQVFGKVGIDMIAGPSEILIISDGTIDAKTIAMDLCAQAEHDEQAQAILLTTNVQHAEDVNNAIEHLMSSGACSPREEILKQSLTDRGCIVVCSDIAEAVGISNSIAPEHLQLLIADAWEWQKKITKAGAIFCGEYSCEVFGDYCAGTNHVLPTAGSARFSSPLGVYDFLTRSSIMQCSQQGAKILAKSAAHLAEIEGLTSHKNSALARSE